LSYSASLGLMDDYAYSAQIQQYPNRRYMTQYNALLRDLASKDLDFSLLDRSVAQFYLERSAALKNSLQVTTITLESKPLHIGMSRQHPRANEVIRDFNRYLKMYLKSHDYQALLDRYKLKITQWHCSKKRQLNHNLKHDAYTFYAQALIFFASNEHPI